MASETPLVGREQESARLEQAFARAREGRGELVLVSGEAGVGKTRLTAAAQAGAGAVALHGAATAGVRTPYAPIVAALRSRLRDEPDALDACGPLRDHLALLLPELGAPPSATDRETLFEAIRCALAHLAGDRSVVAVLEDLHWSDDATLELLAALADPLRQMPVAIVATYRSDGLPRDHRLRWLRNELRRSGCLDELALGPLAREETAQLLGALLPKPPSPALVQLVHGRTLGSPFFIEELVAALSRRGALQAGARGIEVAEHEELPVPDTIREAVVVAASELSQPAHEALEVAAIAGVAFAVDAVIELASEEGVAELVDAGLIVGQARGRACFRHALTREALYAEVPWLRRRALHRRLGELLEARGAPAAEIAVHWLGAADRARAREALRRAMETSEALHAYRDATRAGRDLLELHEPQEPDALRADTLESYARCAELAGELGDAVKAWRELAAIRDGDGDPLGLAQAQRRLAGACELSGERDAAFAARRIAADAFAASGRPADAALEHLAMADHQRRRARYGEAIELAQAARGAAATADREDLVARTLGLLGVVQAKGGDYDAGLATVRAGLALALGRDLTAIAAELYQRLSLVLYDAADYRQAEQALDTALDLCRVRGDPATEVACVTCLIYVLRERGDWDRACELGRELIESDTAVWVAEGLMGAIHAFQGKLSSARRLLTSARAVSSAVGHYNMFIDSTTALGQVAAAEGAHDEASASARTLLARWEQSEDHHYAVWGMRWAATYFAGRRDRGAANACADALAKMASDGGHPDALAALAHAIGELALLEGDAASAADHLARAVDLHRTLSIPHERAQIELRAGVALAAAGLRDEALERLCDAYRTARKLGARPLASTAAEQVAALGESVAQRLGARAAADLGGVVQLTRRELEVLRHVSIGRTNREIAQELFLSQRTVDMHVRNLLSKLECRSRVEASHRAGELGLLA